MSCKIHIGFIFLDGRCLIAHVNQWEENQPCLLLLWQISSWLKIEYGSDVKVPSHCVVALELQIDITQIKWGVQKLMSTRECYNFSYLLFFLISFHKWKGFWQGTFLHNGSREEGFLLSRNTTRVVVLMQNGMCWQNLCKGINLILGLITWVLSRFNVTSGIIRRYKR